MKKRISTLVLVTGLACLLSPSLQAQPATNWTFNYTGSITNWTAPRNGVYTITALGAAGGTSLYGAWLGQGAMAGGSFSFLSGFQLNILSGGSGASGTTTSHGGGGGGGRVRAPHGSWACRAGGAGCGRTGSSSAPSPPRVFPRCASATRNWCSLPSAPGPCSGIFSPCRRWILRRISAARATTFSPETACAPMLENVRWPTTGDGSHAAIGSCRRSSGPRSPARTRAGSTATEPPGKAAGGRLKSWQELSAGPKARRPAPFI